MDKFEAAQKIHNFIPWLACKHHRTHHGHNLEFRTHKYQVQIFHDKNPYIVFIKSTQNGISEWALVRAIGHAIQGMRVFYVLPTLPVVGRYVKERYDKSVRETAYYRGLVKAIKEQKDSKYSDSMSLKDIGDGTIAFVNSMSRKGFVEFPADEVITDELDECDQDNIKMAWERMSHSNYRWQVKISNPTYQGMGIDEEYADTDKMEWHVVCPGGHRVRIDWFKHIVQELDDGRYAVRDQDWTWNSKQDIRPICDQCGRPIDNRGDGLWIPTGSSRKRGYRITKLFSSTVSYVELLDRFNDGLKNDSALQRFYNADLGEAFTAQGSQITTGMLEGCVGSHRPGVEAGTIVAGVDVGSDYNYLIAKLLPEGLRVLKVGKEQDTDQLINTLREYGVAVVVVDGMPETREARKISRAVRLGMLCYFGNVKGDSINPASGIITVQRTPAIDAVKEAIQTKAIQLPCNIMGDKEFVDQMTASVRVYNADKKIGGQTGAYEWVEGNKADHYLLATSYLLIARRLVVLLNRK